MERKKVIIIGPAFPFRGGISNFNNALGKAFYDKSYDITLYSFSLQYPSFLFPGSTQYETGDPPKNLKIKTIINSINPFNWLRVSRLINNEKPDLVIIRYWLPFMAPCLGTISYFLNKKISVTNIIVCQKKSPEENSLINFSIS